MRLHTYHKLHAHVRKSADAHAVSMPILACRFIKNKGLLLTTWHYHHCSHYSYRTMCSCHQFLCMVWQVTVQGLISITGSSEEGNQTCSSTLVLFFTYTLSREGKSTSGVGITESLQSKYLQVNILTSQCWFHWTAGTSAVHSQPAEPEEPDDWLGIASKTRHNLKWNKSIIYNYTTSIRIIHDSSDLA